MSPTRETTAPVDVLHVIDSLQPGGAEQALSLLVRHLDPSRYRARVFALRALGPLASTLAPLGLMANAAVRPGLHRQLADLRRHIRTSRPAIVHTHLNAADFLAGPVARAMGVPFVLSYKASILRKHGSRQRLHNTLTRLAARADHAVVVLSEALKTYLVEQDIVPAAKIRVVHYGVQRDEANAPLVPRELFGEGDGPVVLLPARLEPRKDHQTFLRAAALVRRERPDIRFVFAGDGAPEYRAEVADLAASLQVPVVFLGNRSDVPAVMRACDLVVLSSRTEGLGLVLLEAMAERRAVVATAVGGVPEIVVDGETGLLVPAGDPPALAAAMLRVLGSSVLRQQMGDAGRLRVDAEFTVERMARKIEAVYDELLAAG